MQDPATMTIATLQAAKDWFVKETGVAFSKGTKTRWLKADWVESIEGYAAIYRLQRQERAALEDVCDACGGTGIYDGGTWTGICFRCKGKRVQSANDRVRNTCYDKYHPHH